MSREDPERPRSVTFRLPKKLREPQRRRRNTLERPEDGKAVSPALVLRIVLAVVIQGTLTILWQACQESSRDRPGSTMLLSSGRRQVRQLPKYRCTNIPASYRIRYCHFVPHRSRYCQKSAFFDNSEVHSYGSRHVRKVSGRTRHLRMS